MSFYIYSCFYLIDALNLLIGNFYHNKMNSLLLLSTCSLHALFINSTDRRPMVVNLTTHVPQRQVVLDDFNGETRRVVRATNNCVKLRICLTFRVPVLNSSAEILKSLEPEILYSLPKRQGNVLPLNVSKEDPGHRRFEYMVRWFSLTYFIFQQ